jgi:hypothetical protein
MTPLLELRKEENSRVPKEYPPPKTTLVCGRCCCCWKKNIAAIPVDLVVERSLDLTNSLSVSQMPICRYGLRDRTMVLGWWS